MAFLAKKNPQEEYCNEFESFVLDQDIVGGVHLYEEYSNENLFTDICNILQNDKYFKEKSLLRAVIVLFFQYYYHILTFF
jgi:hypothetical protein